ncbi:hypothetical protein F52700_6038 [Fusarium sp. NRRL 52700]|nr:hypothetical protein F52700_6038 [Fusarium sp. NRRL 52700]
MPQILFDSMQDLLNHMDHLPEARRQSLDLYFVHDDYSDYYMECITEFTTKSNNMTSEQLQRTLRGFYCWHEVWNVLNRYYYNDYTPEEGDPLGLGVHIPRQEARVNVNMFVARLAEDIGHSAFLGAFSAHREEAMVLLGSIVNGASTKPEEFAQVAAQTFLHAPMQTKHCPWPLPGESWERPQAKWETYKNLWTILANHENTAVQQLAWKAQSQMFAVDRFDNEHPEQITISKVTLGQML